MLVPSALLLLASAPIAHAGVLINELQYDPTGSDDGYEWVELCNNGADPVDLSGYTIQEATSSWSTAYTLGAGTIDAGGYVIIGYGGTTWSGSFSPNLPNGGSQTDGVRLTDSTGVVVDTVLYDSPNTKALVDDSGVAGVSFAADVSSAHSLGRWPDCADTNASGVDFADYATPSPGVVNVAISSGDTASSDTASSDTSTSDSASSDTATSDSSSDTATSDSGSTGTDCSGSSSVTINEFTPATGGEWIEVYNAGSTALNVGGWDLAYGTSSFSKSTAIPASTILPAMGWLVVGSSGVAVKDVDAGSMDLGNATSNADAIQLQCLGAAVDTVVYTKGTTNPDGWVDDTGSAATSFAPVPGTGQTVGRMNDGVDTNQSGVDFVVMDTPTPDATNISSGDTGGGDTSSGSADCTGSGDVKINEFTPSTGGEWIELYNAGASAKDVSGWALGYGTSSYSKTTTMPSGTMIPATGWLVIGSTGVTTKDVDAGNMDMGNATSSADAVQLQCNGAPVDTVIYGKATDNSDGWVDDDGVVTTSFAPVPGTGQTTARLSDGYDTNQSATDFAVTDTPTPDAANPVIPPTVCDPTGFESLKLNEFLYDPNSTDSGNEWVELYNGGTADVILDGLQFQAATSSWGTQFTFPGGTTLAAGGFELIGGINVPSVNFQAPSMSLGNGTGGDGVRIVDCNGATVDTALYGDTMTDGLTDDAGSDAVIAKVSSGVSLARVADGVDTDSPDDWHGAGTPTPDASNGTAAAGDTGVGVPKGGCGGEPKATRPGGSTCAVASPLGGGEVLLAALVLVRRKRRA